MRVAIKSIEVNDFVEIDHQVNQLMWMNDELKKFCSARVDVGHPMKYWEWGRLMLAIKETFHIKTHANLSVLDIGAAYSLIGPMLGYLGATVHEAEPDGDCINERVKLNDFMISRESFGAKPITTHAVGYRSLWDTLKRQFDVVCSISVMEHVDLAAEQEAWAEMAQLVLPGGLLAVTADLMPRPGKGFVADDVRWTNYTMEDVKVRVDKLKALGFHPIGAEDYLYHGNHVADYSFASIFMQKEGCTYK